MAIKLLKSLIIFLYINNTVQSQLLSIGIACTL